MHVYTVGDELSEGENKYIACKSDKKEVGHRWGYDVISKIKNGVV